MLPLQLLLPPRVKTNMAVTMHPCCVWRGQLAGWDAADQLLGLSAARLSTLALPLRLLGQALAPQLAS